jgi:hypothetical protein
VSRSDSRTGVAAILAGALIFAGQGAELVFGSTRNLVGGVYVVLWSAGVLALGVALWGLRTVIAGTRLGRIGMRLALVGLGLLVLFAIQLGVAIIRTREIPENFILFALGFVLVLVGQLLFARDLRPALGRAWLFPIIGVAGLLVALTAGDKLGPVHDVGLFVFEAAWIALGVALLRSGARSNPVDIDSQQPES